MSSIERSFQPRKAKAPLGGLFLLCFVVMYSAVDLRDISQSIERTVTDADLSVTLSYAGKKSAEEILSGPCAQTFKVKVPPEAKHSDLSDLAKRAVDSAVKAASLAVLAKMIS